MTISVLTMTSAERQAAHTFESSAQKSRSGDANLGRSRSGGELVTESQNLKLQRGASAERRQQRRQQAAITTERDNRRKKGNLLLTTRDADSFWLPS